MGQKVSPIGFRLGINKTWESKWFRKAGYSQWLKEDLLIRAYVVKNCKSAGISHVGIERAADKCKVEIYSARPGVLIGKKGTEIEGLKKNIQKLSKSEIFLNIHEVRKPEIDANLVAQKVAQELERRVAFRRAMKKVMSTAQKFGVLGIKVMCSGRLGGAEMSRCEWYREGRVPLHTLRADIDYGFAEADTTYGKIGCRVWLFKGEVLPAEATTTKRQATK
jgi:small subunit ribosomal protein S3